MKKIMSFSNFIGMYIDGFKNLTWGKALWIIIIVKLFIMFAILRVFFFPDILNRFDTEEEKSEHVFRELTKNHITNEKKFSNESD